MDPTPAPTRDDVEAVLRKVVDPELGVDIVELQMVQGIEVRSDGHVEVQIALTIAGCPLRAQIRDDARARIRSLPGVTDIEIHFECWVAIDATTIANAS